MSFYFSKKKLNLIPILFLFSSSYASEYGYTVEVEAGRIECFFQSIISESAANVELDYQVLDGGDMDIIFTLTDPKNSILIEDEQRTDNSHKFDVTQLKGDYQFCFDNSFSYTTRKVVFFQTFVYDTNGNFEELDYKKLAQQQMGEAAKLGMAIEDFSNATSRIKLNLNRAEYAQMILRSYEFRDLVMMHANFQRVNFWSVVNLIVMVCVSIIQVYTIRRLFHDNSKMSKLFRART